MTFAFNPAPKPPPREKKPRRPLPRSTSPIDRGEPPAKINVARQKREKPRKYGSPNRCAFVKTLPCAACSVEGYSVNAHVGKKGRGAGRKANANQIAPLCASRMNAGVGVVGCHELFDEHQEEFRVAFPWFDPDTAAAFTEAAWQLQQSK